ncbi:MAG: aminopeptidase P N-terminal domain-containing protein [Candidatus Acidiferrales bacterium]
MVTLRNVLAAAALILISALTCAAQYTDTQAIQDLGGATAFEARRADLAKQCKTGWILLFARTEIPEATHYREDNDYYYFTGLQDPGSAMLVDAATGKTDVFEPQQVPRTAQVYGPNLSSLSDADRAAMGYPTVLPITVLDEFISGRITRPGNESPNADLWVRLNFPDKADGARAEVGRDNGWKFSNPYHEPVPANIANNMLLQQRYPELHLRDVTPFLDAMRNIKTSEEIEVLRRIGKISAEADGDAIAHAKSGMYQFQIEARAYYEMFDKGAQGAAYPAIVSSGNDVNVIHYFADRHQIQANDLVVFDFAGSLDHLTMDITRTFNISGKFTPEQAKWYAVDLEAQKATVALLAAGHTYDEASDAGKAVFEKAGIGEQWKGFPGHFARLATHDVGSTHGPVKAGQVVTVEPYIDFPDKHMHFRVEDTVLITSGAPEVLSSAVPKEMADVEKLVGSANK